MTSINNNNRPQLNRANSAPVNPTQPKPELKRADSAPAKIKNEVKTEAAHLKDKLEGAKPASTSRSRTVNSARGAWPSTHSVPSNCPPRGLASGIPA